MTTTIKKILLDYFACLSGLTLLDKPLKIWNKTSFVLRKYIMATWPWSRLSPHYLKQTIYCQTTCTTLFVQVKISSITNEAILLKTMVMVASAYILEM